MGVRGLLDSVVIVPVIAAKKLTQVWAKGTGGAAAPRRRFSRTSRRVSVLEWRRAFEDSSSDTGAAGERSVGMDLYGQVATLFLLAIPVACVAWTVTHEEVFREPREFCVDKSKSC